MTAYAPTISFPKPTALILPDTPKLAYEIGEVAWIHAGASDQHGNPAMTEGKVVFWFDLPDLAQRFYVVRLVGTDFMHLLTRDATVMSPAQHVSFPFRKTRHDKNTDPPRARSELQ